ncbi:uncharacterized protein LAESUDRAFT_659053 [Laetiporus sulphureus 93-53]|uniref:Uncharacterized protein n=1 Tax=Laetiporus sulphureus 93-53 TaxID=1314785 RepID=A0A165CZ52_9APHY|nr:uncharacterized protein LAESUDRAFT_659053 [Laetiporus sulphureus 93-53]KZT03789.1 hypothetical protein LAESUDRAFT_659053 [Laetiporus sulphureus 93-53]
MPSYHRGWLYPPTRREFTLLLFSLIVFVLSYNLETSLQIIGVNPAKLSSGYLSTIGLGTKDPGFEPDGRRPKEWRDELENLIFGEWEWEEDQVAGVERGLAGIAVGTAAVYNVETRRKASRSTGKDDKGVGLNEGVTVKEQLLRWEEEIPVARALAHVPGMFHMNLPLMLGFVAGYTILENAIMLNGTLFLVTEEPASLPSLGAVGSSATDRSQPPREEDWQVLNRQQAISRLGDFGGRLFGTTWLSMDPSSSQDPYTLFSMFRAQSALAIPSSAFASSEDSAKTIDVPAPLRLIYQNVSTFSSPRLPPPGDDPKKHPPMRERSYNGLHPLLTKAALPTLGVWYEEDWQDIIDMDVPWLFDRVVVVDRHAADRGRDMWTRPWSATNTNTIKESENELRKRAEGDDGKPAWAAPFVGLRAKPDWWTPVRAALLSYLRMEDSSAENANSNLGRGKKAKSKAVPTKPIVTYVSMQDEPNGAGPRLRDEDHAALLAGLRGLEREGVVGEVHVVKGNGSVAVHGWEWADRMRAIARSSIVLGPYGFHLADSIFMAPPSWHSVDLPTTSLSPSEDEQNQAPVPLLMEFFPPGIFMPDQEFAVRSLGMRYMAWWNDRKFTGNSLPPVISPGLDADPNQRLSISADAIVQAIRDEIAQRRIS